MRLTEEELAEITLEKAMAHVHEEVYKALEFINQLHEKGLIKGYPEAYRNGMGNYAAHGLRIRWDLAKRGIPDLDNLNQTTGNTTWLQKLRIRKKPD